MPNINLSDKPKDLINQTKFPFNHDKFNSYTSYSNYDFTNTIYLEEEKEKKYKSLPFILSDIFSLILLIIVLMVMILIQKRIFTLSKIKKSIRKKKKYFL